MEGTKVIRTAVACDPCKPWYVTEEVCVPLLKFHGGDKGEVGRRPRSAKAPEAGADEEKGEIRPAE